MICGVSFAFFLVRGLVLAAGICLQCGRLSCVLVAHPPFNIGIIPHQQRTTYIRI